MARGTKQAIVWRRFDGGWSSDLKLGPKNSYAYSLGFDFRKSPSQLSVLPKTTREDNGVVTDLIMHTVMHQDGTIYALGNAGRFYKRTTAGVWSLESNLSNAAVGLDIRSDADMLLAAGTKTVSRYMPLSSNPVMVPDVYGPSISLSNNSDIVGFNVAAFQDSGTKTYTLPTAISENPGQLRYFQSDIEPLGKISPFIIGKGTGDWTLTLHDGLNNVLGTSTVTNANLANNTWNDFVFASQVRIYVTPNARTYHFHLTSTVADGTVACTDLNDLSGCDLQVWADRLVQTTSGYHQIVRFQQYETIANGNYLSVWEPLNLESPSNDEWFRHRLAFPQEYDMIGLAQTNEFEIMALAKTSTNAASTPQAGLLAFWDGTSPTYNFTIDVPEGSPQGLHTYKNVAYYYAGTDWWAVDSLGGRPVKIRSMPGASTEYSGTNTPITVHPYAATVRRGIHLFAWPSVVTNTEINFGVYSWGQTDKNFAEAFGYNYLISTLSQNYSVGNNLQLGGIWSYGDLLLLSWRDTTSGGYGIDAITNASVPAATATWEGLIVDNGYAGKQFQAHYVAAYYSLPAGATITLAYKLDREATWHTSEAYSTTNLWDGQPGYARFNIDTPARCREVQIQLVVTCDSTVTTPPVVYEASVVIDSLKDEALI